MPDDRIKRPAYQWYVNDARGDEIFMLMTYEQQGIYRALLDHQWIEGSIPADLDRLAYLLRLRVSHLKKVWPLILGKFRPYETDRLLNDRLDIQRKNLDEFVAIQKAKGQKGGQKRAANLAAATVRLEPKSSSSSSTSTSVPVAKEQLQGAAPKPPSPAKEFLTWFQSEYKTRRHGAVYFVAWEKHMPIVGRLLKLHAPDRLKKHAQILLTTDEDWTETTDRGIEVLAGKINWLEERLCAWEVKRRANG